MFIFDFLIKELIYKYLLQLDLEYLEAYKYVEGKKSSTIN